MGTKYWWQNDKPSLNKDIDWSKRASTHRWFATKKKALKVWENIPVGSYLIHTYLLHGTFYTDRWERTE
jgi:hypothetical protein